MRSFHRLLYLLLIVGYSTSVEAQSSSNVITVPKGKVVYSLPQTVLVVRAEAVKETFVAGPYAKYAKKMLGVEALSKNSESVTLTEVEIRSFVEPDNRKDLFVDISRVEKEGASFIKMTESGLILLPELYKASDTRKQFYTGVDTLFNRVGELSHLEERNSVLYKVLDRPEGAVKMELVQSGVVAKDSERKASETADLIKRLRSRRIDLITGESETQYTGDALKVLLAEIDRLEESYLSLFIGRQQRDTQKIAVEILPPELKLADQKSLLFVAFRISDSLGLLQPDNLYGRPVILELIRDSAEVDQIIDENVERPKNTVFYRKPLTVRLKLIDSGKLLIENRIPIYQMGDILTYPLK